MSHATPSMSHHALGHIRPTAPRRRPAAREPLGMAAAKVIAVISGTVLLGSVGLLLVSVLTG